ncbi:MAG: hypothetical protein RLZZ436_3465 [Planctomycetota bacterium]
MIDEGVAGENRECGHTSEKTPPGIPKLAHPLDSPPQGSKLRVLTKSFGCRPRVVEQVGWMFADEVLRTHRFAGSGPLRVSAGTTLQQRYKLLERLGAGGMGEAWKASDSGRLVDGQPADVVIKLLPLDLRLKEEANEDIRREYSRVWLLSHPHICKLFDMGEQEGVGCFQVMQYLPGLTLRQWLRKQRGPLPNDVILRVLEASAEALDYAHTAPRPVVHRDIKPENIIHDPQTGAVHVIDFGLAAEIRDSQARYSRGHSAIAGTPAYISPEQWEGRPATAACDQWALGIVAWELLTGACPFQGSGMTLGFAICQAQVPQLPSSLRKLQPVFERVLRKDPQERFETCVEFAEELGAVLTDGSVRQKATAARRAARDKPPAPPPKLAAPFSSTEAAAAQAAWGTWLQLDVQWKDEFGQEFRLIPPGEFHMGSDETLEHLEADGFLLPSENWQKSLTAEGPRHRVRMTQPFYLGVSAVTRGLFATFVRATGYRTEAEADGRGGWGYDATGQCGAQRPEFTWKNTGFEQTDEHPVVNVTWNDAQACVKWLNERSAAAATGKRYRLAREAEWEYACRAGTTGRFFTGNTPESLEGFANVQDESFARAFPGVDFAAWQQFRFDDGWPFTSPAGRYSSNAFGLVDMLGNVWEWCEDWYRPGYHRRSNAEDPRGPASGSTRVLRGGSWNYDPVYLRCSARNHRRPEFRSNYTGFRLVVKWS